MGKDSQGSAEKSAEIISGDREAWSETGGVYQVGHTPDGICINNAKNLIAAILKNRDLREIVKDLILDPYESWWEMEYY